MERELADENISAYERLRFEIEHCGTPISTFADLKNEYAVLDIDNRFSPKVRLYSIATARIGMMKIRKRAVQASSPQYRFHFAADRLGEKALLSFSRW